MKTKLALMLLLILSAIFLSACSCEEESEITPEVGRESAPGSIAILNKELIKNSEGVPITVRLIADMPSNPEVSCRLAYSDVLVGNERLVETNEFNKVTFFNVLNGRMNLNKWTLCCSPSTEGLAKKTANTFCSN